jgi:hypothetical protein
MHVDIPEGTIVRFLISAKQRTYASGGGDSACAVDPVLKGSHQLEYSAGELLYRDIYFGASHFAGQEVLYYRSVPIWSMCYAGGWTVPLDADEIGRLAGLLQNALRAVPTDYPFRGPPSLADPPYRYHNAADGAFGRFEGTEIMEREGEVLYRLVYTGGHLD